MSKKSAGVVRTSLTALFWQGIAVVSYFALTPAIFNALGAGLYGVYQFVQKVSLFGGISNLGATSYLKIRLSALSESDADADKRLAVGVCIVQWLIMSPVLAVLLYFGAGLVSKMSEGNYFPILAMLAVVPITQLFSIPQVALFSENKGFRFSHINPLMGILGGLLSLLFINMGMKLLGVALSMWISAVLVGIASLMIAKKYVVWYGVVWPKKNDVIVNLASSIGATVASMVYLGMQQIEAILFGAISGPELLAKVVITGVMVHLAELFIRQFVNATIPALAPMLASGNKENIKVLRSEIQTSIFLVYALVAFPILFSAQAIVGVWVGASAFASHEILSALLLYSYLRICIQFDSLMLDQFGDFKWKFAAAAAIFFLTIICAFALKNTNLSARWFYVVGAALVFYWLIIDRRLKLFVGEHEVVKGGVIFFVMLAPLGYFLDEVLLPLQDRVIVAMILEVATIFFLLTNRKSRSVALIMWARVIRATKGRVSI